MSSEHKPHEDSYTAPEADSGPAYAPGDPYQGSSPTGATDDDRTMGMICHLMGLLAYGTAIFHIVGPLIVWLLKKDQSRFIDYHGREAVNFNISFSVWGFLAALTLPLLIGFVLVPIVAIAHIALSIIAGIKTKDGEMYRYPFTIRLV